MDDDITLAALVADYWKLLRSFERFAAELPPERMVRAQAQARFSATRLSAHLDAFGLQLATFDGQELSPTLPIIAVNADEIAGEATMFVENTIEPAVVSGSRVLLTGRVVAAHRNSTGSPS